MAACALNVVTGAFGYTGRYIARRLLSLGKQVATLTRRPIEQSPFGGQVRAMPLQFDRLDALTEALAGATTLYNTYWVRFPHRRVTFESAVENTRTLIQAAQVAGVRRIVQVSITNPSLDSPLGYFRGKARLEDAVRENRIQVNFSGAFPGQPGHDVRQERVVYDVNDPRGQRQDDEKG